MRYLAHVFTTTLTTLLMAISLAASTSAQTWPSQQIRLICPFPAGGAADLTARTLAERFAAALGQPAFVENRTGSNGVIGMDAVAKAKPDGYTILMTDRGSLGINASFYPSLPFDPVKSFAFIGVATEGPVVIVVDPKLGLKSIADLVALAKAKPTNYASYGIGSLSHLAFEAFNDRAGIRMVHIPYKGSAPAALAVIQGDVAVSMAAPSTVMGHVKAGRLAAIAVNTPAELPQFPGVPTLKSAGFDDVFVSTFFALAAPAGTPAPIVARYNSELRKALADPAVSEKITSVGLVPAPSSPEDATKLIENDIARFGAQVRKLGIKAE